MYPNVEYDKPRRLEREDVVFVGAFVNNEIVGETKIYN